MNSSKRNGLIDLYKFVAAIVIVCFHFRGHFSLSGKLLFQSSYLMVELFFIISGIMVAQEANHMKGDYSGKEGLLHLKKSFMRLMPNYLLAWFCSFVVKHIVEQQIDVKTILVDLISSFGEVLLLRSVGVRGYFSNSPTWYLSVMIVSGFSLYGLIRINKENYYGVFAPIIFAILFGYTYYNYGGSIPNDLCMCGGLVNGNTLVGFMDMCLGTILWKISSEIKPMDNRKRLYLSVISWLCVLCVFVYSIGHIKIDYADWVIFLPLSYFILIAYSRVDVIGKYFDNKIVFYLGKMSFNMYLIHWPIASIVKTYANNKYCILIYLLLVIVSALVLSYVSDILCRIWKRFKM